MRLKNKKVSKRLLLVVSVSLLFITGILFSQSQSWFFLRTGQHRVDISQLSGDFDPNDLEAIFEGKSINLASNNSLSEDSRVVLGESIGADKRIEIDLTNQRLYAFEDDRKVYEFVISTGRTVTPTPTGEFRPWIKLRSAKMEGGRGSGYYYLPNVPYIMYFENDEIAGSRGYGIHGTYWHDNFGTPMSHGCVNLKTADAENLFYWAEPDLEGHRNVSVTSHNPGTRIIIYGETPQS